MNRDTFRSGLDAVASCAMIATAVLLFWAIREQTHAPRQPSQRTSAEPAGTPIPNEPVSLKNAATLGHSSAAIAMIEYADFQCPYCGKFERDAMPEVIRRYVSTGKLLLAFIHLPLNQHRFAEKAAEAAECAAKAGKFWQMHDLLFVNQADMDRSSLLERASKLGLSGPDFSACLDGGTMTRQVQTEAAEAQELQVRGTPTFMFGLLQKDDTVKVSRIMAGAVSSESIGSVISSLLPVGRGGN